MTKVIVRTTLLIGLFVIVAAASYAKGFEPGITFATQGIDLKIDSKAWYNGLKFPSGTWKLKDLVPGVDRFWNFKDIKPGDYGTTIISMHVKSGDAWLCLDFKNLQSKDNGQNEPEALLDSNGTAKGELAKGMEFFSWLDDGDNNFEKGEKPLFGTSVQSASEVLDNKTYPIGDTQNGRSCRTNESRYVGIYWCAGNLTVDIKSAKLSCDGSVLGNAAQTDSMTVDVAIRALPAKENPKFICKKDEKYHY